MTLVIGITGGIGAGKSTLSQHLKSKGYPVHDSDEVVSGMYKKPNRSFLELLIKNGLADAVENKTINKKKISSLFFKNKKTKEKLEKFIHREVTLSRHKFIKKNTKNKNKAIFLEIPLLLENNLENEFDLVLSILSTKKNREKRAIVNKSFSKKTLNKIFKIQSTDKERKKRSQLIIYNNTSKKDFILSAEKALMDVIYERSSN
tara:strand:- start:10213 stop:10824 length:612 start_codon:yes stop_codon:yes gene_type:complete